MHKLILFYHSAKRFEQKEPPTPIEHPSSSYNSPIKSVGDVGHQQLTSFFTTSNMKQQLREQQARNMEQQARNFEQLQKINELEREKEQNELVLKLMSTTK